MATSDHLGYLFWHAPAPGSDRDGYEAALMAWQQALGRHPPPGFVRGWTWRLPVPPWLTGWPGTVYLDVYVVADFAALGTLNAHAPTGVLQIPHDVAAGRSAYGSGALFQCRDGAGGPPQGEPSPPSTRLWWYDKPGGVSYPGALADLAGEGRSVWLRQMVLGAGPELLVMGDAPSGTSQTEVWAGTATML